MDAGNMLKPMLARGELRAIGATTLDEYRQHIEKDPALERRFQPVLVEEPSVEDTIGDPPRLEGALRGAPRRADPGPGARRRPPCSRDRYVTGRFLPDKAIDLIDEAARRACASRSTRCRSRSTRSSGASVSSRSRSAALSKETDQASKDRLARLEEELADLEEERNAMTAHWQQEKERIDSIRELQGAIEEARADVRARGARGRPASERPSSDTARSSSSTKQLEEENAALEELQRDRKMLNEEVTEEDVAEVVSKWTGIPVVAADGGRDAEARPPRGGAARAGRRIRTRRWRRSRTRSVARAPGCRIRTGRSGRSCSSGRPASARPSSLGRSPTTCSTTSARSCAST